MFRSPYSLTPKLWGALELIQQCLDRNEQTLVFAPFHDPLDTLGRLLSQAGLRYGQMDGRTSPARRGVLSAQFKRGEFPIILGSEACAEGHDWPQARNAILIAYSWSPDKIKQFLDRIWRLTSAQDINVYLVVTEGTIDERMADLHEEKCDAQELVLDGELLAEDPRELGLADLMDFATATYDPEARTVDEAQLAADWPAFCERLRESGRRWSLGGEDKSEIRNPKSEANPKSESEPPVPLAIDHRPSLTVLPDPVPASQCLTLTSPSNIILLPVAPRRRLRSAADYVRARLQFN